MTEKEAVNQGYRAANGSGNKQARPVGTHRS
jgi:hypothetical protein